MTHGTPVEADMDALRALAACPTCAERCTCEYCRACDENHWKRSALVHASLCDACAKLVAGVVQAARGHRAEPATLEEIRDALDPDCLLADGFEEALVGWVAVAGRPTVALYDRDLCLGILMRRDGMTLEDAVEYFEFNVAEAYVGERTPAFAEILR